MTDQASGFSDAALARYLSGECDSAEGEAIARWIEADPERRRRVESLRAAWAEAERPLVDWDTESMWARVGPQLDRSGEKAPPELRVVPAVESPINRKHRPWLAGRRSPPWGIAASALLLLGGAAGVVWLTQRGQPAPAATAPTREIATARGQRADFRLSDGSHVILSVASRLRVPADFGVRSRELYLDGEAYFDVAHDSTKSFVVHTKAATTEDIGTRFGVRAYPEDSATRVVVAEGRVAVRPAASPPPNAWLLGRGEAARIEAEGSVVVREQVDADRLLAWTEGRLVFDNTALGDALPMLRRWYDLDLRLADPAMANRRFTATFHRESAVEAIRLIARSLELRLNRHGNSIVLSRAAASGAR
jgi:transmembrane sensor